VRYGSGHRFGAARDRLGGQRVYFCCDGCKIEFERSPEKYLAAAPADVPAEPAEPTEPLEKT
jgi:hypothetical protein